MTNDEILRGLNSRNVNCTAKSLRAARRLVFVPEKLLELADREAQIYRQRAYRGTLISLGALGGVTLLGMALMALFNPVARHRQHGLSGNRHNLSDTGRVAAYVFAAARPPQSR